MNLKTLLVNVISLAVLVPCVTLAQQAKADEWKKPFNGKTLEGWKQHVGTAPFTVEDGTIVGRSKARSLSSYLCTEAVYGDFELEFEVKCDTGLNSGFQLRTRQITANDVAPEKQKMVGRVFGPQVEIESSPGQAGYIYGQGMGGWLSAVPKQKDKAARSHTHYQNDKWNQFRVLAQGPRIQTFVNGHPVADLNDPESFRTHPKGFLGLQVHMVGRKQELYKVSWRNIRIRELTTPKPETPSENSK